MSSARTAAFGEARRLVVEEGCSYAEAAQVTGIPESTIQKRAAAEMWQAMRGGSMTYMAQVRALKAAMLARLIRMSADPQTPAMELSQVLASWTNLERTCPEHKYAPAESDPRQTLTARMEAMDALVQHLEKTDTNALGVLAPHIRGFITAEERRLAAA